jgi:hypothetical protein
MSWPDPFVPAALASVGFNLDLVPVRRTTWRSCPRRTSGRLANPGLAGRSEVVAGSFGIHDKCLTLRMSAF